MKAMRRILQINTNGSWKNVLEVIAGGEAVETLRTAVELLSSIRAQKVAFRVVCTRVGEEDKCLAAFEPENGWRIRPGGME